MKAVLKRRLALLCYAFGPHVFYKICLFAGMQDVFMSRLGALSVVGRIAMVKKWDETITVAEFTKSNNPLARLIALDKGDITKLEIDAIVNAANSSLLGGGGVDGAIHRAAGRRLYDECKKLNGCRILFSDIIHTVGPQVYSEVTEDQRNLLKSCYIESLKIAAAKNLRTIAFPCISTGVYGYPNDDACNVVVTSILAWLEENKNKIDRIIFVTFLDKDYDLYEKCLKERLA
ncbi:ADP-ribose glycohydrolase MACROD1 [Dirofilaria immitis]